MILLRNSSNLVFLSMFETFRLRLIGTNPKYSFYPKGERNKNEKVISKNKKGSDSTTSTYEALKCEERSSTRELIGSTVLGALFLLIDLLINLTNLKNQHVYIRLVTRVNRK